MLLDYLDLDSVEMSANPRFERTTGKEKKPDLFITISSKDKSVSYRIRLQLEHKSKLRRKDSLQTYHYTIHAYEQELDERKSAQVPLNDLQTKPLENEAIGKNQTVLSPIIQIILYHGKARKVRKPNLDSFFGHVPKEVRKELKPYIQFPNIELVNLRDFDENDWPNDIPELLVMFRALSYIFDSNKEERLYELYKILIEQTDRFETINNCVDIRDLVVNYFDCHSKNINRKKLEEWDNRFKNKIEKSGEQMTSGLLYKTYIKGMAEGKAEGMAEGKAETLVSILNQRFGSVSQEIRSAIYKLCNTSVFDSFLTKALKSESLEEFEKSLPLN